MTSKKKKIKLLYVLHIYIIDPKRRSVTNGYQLLRFRVGGGRSFPYSSRYLHYALSPTTCGSCTSPLSLSVAQWTRGIALFPVACVRVHLGRLWKPANAFPRSDKFGSASSSHILFHDILLLPVMHTRYCAYLL